MLQEEEKKYIINTYNRSPENNPLIVRGKGTLLWDENGKQYLDFVGGLAVNAFGHAYPPVVSAAREQMERIIHASNLYYTAPQVELAKCLVENSALEKTFFCNSGAEANEAALKLAFKHTGRSRVVSTYNSFHGRTAAALSVTGQKKYQSGFEPLLSGAVDLIDYGGVEQLKSAVTKDTAAVILEPIQAEGGVIPASRELFRAARDLCDERGALLICDEVQTGMCRTGRFFGFQHYDVVPDIISLAKALGNGYPIGAVVASKQVASTFVPGSHGTTFGGNPLGAAIARTVVETMRDERMDVQAAERGDRWMKRLRDIADRSDGRVKAVRGRGLIIGLEMGEEAKKVQAQALENGILVNVCAGSVVRLIPPLILSDSSMKAFDDVLESFLA